MSHSFRLDPFHALDVGCEEDDCLLREPTDNPLASLADDPLSRQGDDPEVNTLKAPEDVAGGEERVGDAPAPLKRLRVVRP